MKVKINFTYRRVPVEITCESKELKTLDRLGPLLDNIKKFVDSFTGGASAD